MVRAYARRDAVAVHIPAVVRHRPRARQGGIGQALRRLKDHVRRRQDELRQHRPVGIGDLGQEDIVAETIGEPVDDVGPAEGQRGGLVAGQSAREVEVGPAIDAEEGTAEGGGAKGDVASDKVGPEADAIDVILHEGQATAGVDVGLEVPVAVAGGVGVREGIEAEGHVGGHRSEADGVEGHLLQPDDGAGGVKAREKTHRDRVESGVGFQIGDGKRADAIGRGLRLEDDRGHAGRRHGQRMGRGGTAVGAFPEAGTPDVRPEGIELGHKGSGLAGQVGERVATKDGVGGEAAREIDGPGGVEGQSIDGLRVGASVGPGPQKVAGRVILREKCVGRAAELVGVAVGEDHATGKVVGQELVRDHAAELGIAEERAAHDDVAGRIRPEPARCHGGAAGDVDAGLPRTGPACPVALAVGSILGHEQGAAITGEGVGAEGDGGAGEIARDEDVAGRIQRHAAGVVAIHSAATLRPEHTARRVVFHQEDVIVGIGSGGGQHIGAEGGPASKRAHDITLPRRIGDAARGQDVAGETAWADAARHGGPDEFRRKLCLDGSCKPHDQGQHGEDGTKTWARSECIERHIRATKQPSPDSPDEGPFYKRSTERASRYSPGDQLSAAIFRP